MDQRSIAADRPLIPMFKLSPLPLWERMPEGQERGRERSDACFGSFALDVLS